MFKYYQRNDYQVLFKENQRKFVWSNENQAFLSE